MAAGYAAFSVGVSGAIPSAQSKGEQPLTSRETLLNSLRNGIEYNLMPHSRSVTRIVLFIASSSQSWEILYMLAGKGQLGPFRTLRTFTVQWDPPPV